MLIIYYKISKLVPHIYDSCFFNLVFQCNLTRFEYTTDRKSRTPGNHALKSRRSTYEPETAEIVLIQASRIIILVRCLEIVIVVEKSAM